MGVQLYRRDYDSFKYTSTGSRNTTYSQLSTGGSVRTGFPVTEFMTGGFNYSLVNDKVSLDRNTFYTDPDGTGPLDAQCDPLKAGRYLCDEIGTHLTSLLGYSILYDDTNGDRPTRGQRLVLSQDFAGLGGDVKYLRTRLDGTKYRGFGGGWVASAHAEGGYIAALQKSPGPGRDAIRLTDRFFGPQLRGFDIRGIGPRILRFSYNADGTVGATERYQRRFGRPRLLHGPAGARIPGQLGDARASACVRLRSSTPVRCGASRSRS